MRPAAQGLVRERPGVDNADRGVLDFPTQIEHATKAPVTRLRRGPADAPVSVVVVINTGSAEAEAARRLRDVIERTRPSIQIIETTGVGEFRRFAAMAATRGFHRVVVAGGDGTMQSATHEFAGTGIEVGLLPMGSDNDFARMIGIPTDLEGSLSVALGSAVTAIDVGIIHCRDHGFRAVKFRFANIAEAGLGVDALRQGETGKASVGQRLAYRAGMLLGLRGMKVPPIRLTIDGKDLGVSPTARLIIGNGQHLAGMRPLPQARINDGLFDVVRMRDVSRPDIARLAGAPNGIPRNHPEIDHWRARRVEATSDEPVPIEADGEQIGWLPAAFEIEPGNLRLVVPESLLRR